MTGGESTEGGKASGKGKKTKDVAVTRKDVARLEQADKYAYLWHKAYKRIEIRDIPGFGELAARVVDEHRTGMRQDRLYTLWQAMAGLPDNDHPIVEVGVAKGGSARFMAEAMRFLKKTRRFVVADTFTGHVVVDPELDGPHRVGEQFTNVSAEEVRNYLSDLPEVEFLVGDFRETSASLESQGPFAFAHLDVDVFPVMKFALEFFSTRVSPGCLIVVDDYGFVTCRGARQAVDEFVGEHPNYRFIHLLTGQALLVRLH